MEDFANFARLVEAIRPWLGHVVIVGGWAHRLHRFHPLATAQEYQPLRTRDVDLAFSLDAPLQGDLRKALSKAGFREELSGEDTPPVTHYRLGEEDAGFYAEFLTAKKGSGLRRDGQPDPTVLKAGVTAQKLRHLDLLLEAPWLVRIGPETMPITRPVDLLVPNPVSFVVQKFLIQALAEGSGGGERMCVLKVTTVGHSVGVILPREILERLRVAKGDILYAVETKNGIELTANDPTFAAQVEAAERVMREDRDALKKLAE